MTVTQSTLTDADVIINAVEINDRHGVGILLQRIFKDRSNIITIRNLNSYGGEQSFGSSDLLVGVGLSRAKIFKKVRLALSGCNVDRILCIPYNVEEAFVALAVREISGAKICTYLMDDQNVITAEISDEVMSELLTQSDLCLAISHEMRDVYQVKYGVPIYFTPPVIPADLVNNKGDLSLATALEPVGAIFGNIWSSKWLELLRIMTKGAGIQLDWYGNTGADWNFRDRSKLSSDGIIEREFLPKEVDVVAALRNYSYIVVPSGTLDLRDDNLATSWLSLPSRIPFIMATTNTPIIVLGSPNTAAARFVKRFGIGTVADYDPESFRAAITYITQPSVQQRMRKNAVEISHRFVNEQMDKWIWQSLELGKPIDDRFEILSANPLEYVTAFATCLNFIRQQQYEINQLKLRSKLFSSPIEYIRQISYKWLVIRKIWLRLKGQL
jgi:hypothetical protein